MILTLVAACLIGCALIVAFIGFLTAAVFITAFRRLRHLMSRRRKAISLKANSEIRRALRNNDVTHVSGVWDEDRDSFVDATAWEADEVDSEMQHLHKKGKVVVWS